jgi:DNA helicase-2/ATP-dependent DNA helicase PcrA
VDEYDDEEDEARGVAQALREAHSGGTPWRDMAVLYRTNAQSAAFEEALGRGGIPYRVRGAARFLDRPEVKAALADLRTAASRAPRSTPFVALLDALGSNAETAERREHVDALIRLGHEYVALDGANATVDGFAAHLTATLRDDVPSGDDAVELLTFHRAKGLEFAFVFVTGLERGLVPIAHASTPTERAEERRLLYVALTRATQSLRLSCARTRTVGGRTASRARSPWLAPVEASWADAADAPRADPRPVLRATRARLGDLSPADPGALTAADRELLGALVEWRRRLARASAVPAFVVFSDATLRAIARLRPATPEELLAVPGIGRVKAERHGAAVLEIVESHRTARSSTAART